MVCSCRRGYLLYSTELIALSSFHSLAAGLACTPGVLIRPLSLSPPAHTSRLACTALPHQWSVRLARLAARAQLEVAQRAGLKLCPLMFIQTAVHPRLCAVRTSKPTAVWDSGIPVVAWHVVTSTLEPCIAVGSPIQNPMLSVGSDIKMLLDCATQCLNASLPLLVALLADTDQLYLTWPAHSTEIVRDTPTSRVEYPEVEHALCYRDTTGFRVPA